MSVGLPEIAIQITVGRVKRAGFTVEVSRALLVQYGAGGIVEQQTAFSQILVRRAGGEIAGRRN
jgi:hypothetical protein